MIKRYLYANRFYLITFAVIIATLLFSLLFGITKLENEFEAKMLKITTSDIIEITKNVTRDIQDSLDPNGEFVKEITEDKRLQKHIDRKLSLLLTENIKYAYLIYKDSKNIFRFLADGSPVGEKAHVQQKFDVESPKWQEVYETKTPILIQQPFLHQLSFSYLSPIVKDKEVKLLLAIDFSIKKAKDVNQIIGSVKNIIKFIIFTMIVFILILVVQVIKYYTMKKSVYIDKLTGLYNRNYLQEVVEYLDFSEYVLAVLDIDHFKRINDSYGHNIGDIVLEVISKEMQLSLRSKEDVIIRYGGEEFILLIKKSNNTDEDSALRSIYRIFTKIRDSKITVMEKVELNITISIGVNPYPAETRGFKEAFKLADKALYEAKEAGRNQVVVYSKE